jgi:hypothetical protein
MSPHRRTHTRRHSSPGGLRSLQIVCPWDDRECGLPGECAGHECWTERGGIHEVCHIRGEASQEAVWSAVVRVSGRVDWPIYR